MESEWRKLKKDLNAYKENGSIYWGEFSIYLIICYRICCMINGIRLFLFRVPLKLIVYPIYYFFYIIFGISIPINTSIGGGLRIRHFGGIVLNPSTVIGDNCTILNGVTIGAKGKGGKSPTLGDNVYIGVGAKVLGEITIGNNVKIGANAVVLQDIPDNATAVGIPAKIILK